MPSAITVHRKNRRPRTLSGEKRPMQREVPVGIVSVTPSGNDVTILFNQTVNLTGIPQYLKNGTIAPTAANQTAPNTVVLSYPAGPEATDINIPAEDPAIRNSSGGYVAPTSFPV
jgi:hypothetical protein